MYVGRNVIVIVAGDVDPKVVRVSVARALSAIPAGTGYIWKPAPESTLSGPRMAIVDKPDATETQFRIGLPGIARRDPDRTVLWLTNTLFGGRFTSVLNDALRVNSGLTYGARSLLDRDHLPGRITVSSYTATANTVKAIDMALDVLRNFAEHGITAAQLESAREYLKGTYPVDHLETADQIAGEIGAIELFDLNRSEVDDFFGKLDAITLEQANAAIRKYYTPRNLTFLLLGNASQFSADVTKYSPNAARTGIRTPGYQIGNAPAQARSSE